LDTLLLSEFSLRRIPSAALNFISLSDISLLMEDIYKAFAGLIRNGVFIVDSVKTEENRNFFI